MEEAAEITIPMAEVLGIVSGAVGLAGFAVQILDSVQKIRNLSLKLKHSHSRLAGLLDELELLSTLLPHCESNTAGVALQFPDCGRHTPFTCCNQATNNVLHVLKNIKGGFQRSKAHSRKASLKFVLQEEHVEHNLRKLERDKSLLLLAQQLATR